MWRILAICSLTVIGIVLPLARAEAQSEIVGVVRDASGGVLPGVSVETTSPALIEGARSTTTDARGEYRLADLRPGIYRVAFSLQGFTTLIREGVSLPTAFTATINVELTVGTLAETLTVTGESPLVDARGSVAQSVLSRDDLDVLPTGKDVFAIGQLLPGVKSSRPDVGGSEGMQQLTMEVHGSSQRDMVYQQDGMSINNNFGTGNQTGFYYNDGAIEEISYQTSGLPAEVGVGGVRINMIPRVGGNEFHGAVFATGANSSMAADNQSDELYARGLTLPNRLKSAYDINTSLGGPISRDKMWFFGSFRRRSYNWYVANTTNPDGTQFAEDNVQTDITGRLTLLAGRDNRISVGYQRGWPERNARRTNQPATFVSPEAALLQTTPLNYIAQAKWTSTLSAKMFFETGLSVLKGHFNTGYRPETEPTDVTKFDFTRSLLYNAPIYDSSSNPNPWAYMASLSYATARHNLKTGVQLRWGPNYHVFQKNGDILLRFNNGVADSVDLFNSPVSPRRSLDADHGLFVQDSWTLERLTLNVGVRLDRFKLSIPANSAPAGTWVPARSYPEIPVVAWTNVVPRLGFVYDPFGSGRTAIKGSASRYVQGEGVGLADLINPVSLQSQRCAWRDTNLDTEAQAAEIFDCQGFAGGLTTTIDPDIKRPHNWEYVAQVQHQLRPSVALSAGYYHRRASNLYGTRNLAVPTSAYTPVTITNPLTLQPMTVYNQNPATVGRQENLLTNQPDDLWTRYHGFELTTQVRLGARGRLHGGFTVGRNEGSTLGESTDLNNPNLLINHIGAVGFDATYQVNLAGSWMLPAEVQLSGSLRGGTGLPLNRTFTVTRAIVPGLTQVSQTVLLAPRGEYRLEDDALVDLRVSKVFRVAGMQLEGIADIYNVLNSNATLGEVQVVGPSLGRPSDIVPGRMLRLGAQLRF
jgi:hypothetical protein